MKPFPPRLRVPVALTIAGSDSGGGAGIQADLKTFAALGVHGTAAITAITAQNTLGVLAVQDVDLEIIGRQIDAVAEDIGVDAAKTGMLHRSEVIELVAEKVGKYGFPLVVDPIILAKSGARLLREGAEETLRRVLVPLATVVTPNAMEAEVLSGVRVETIEGMKEAARRIAELGPRAVVVKGGHVPGRAVDVLYYEGELTELVGERLGEETTHGTGCVFSAAITAELAKGRPILEAVRTAKELVSMAIQYGIRVGMGVGPVNPTSWLQLMAERHEVLSNLWEAVGILESHGEVANLIPEVQSNIVMALPHPYAKGVEDAAGIPGRIVRFKNRVKASGYPEFGASLHVARAVLKAMEYDGRFRAAMNIKYSPEVVEACRRLEYVVSSFSRREEPEEVKAVEGRTVAWGVERAIEKVGRVPEAIYDLGDVGKEPMVTIFGRDAVEVAGKVLAILRELKKMERGSG